MRLAALLLLVPCLSLAQGLNSKPPGVARGTVVLSRAFATPGCYASGTNGVTLTRASIATYMDANGDLQTCNNNEYRVDPDGILVEIASANVTYPSNTISTGTAFNLPWVAWPDTTVVNVTTPVDVPKVTGTWAEVTNAAGTGSNVGQVYQTVTATSSQYHVASVTMAKPVGEASTHAAVQVGCGAGTPVSCTCLRADSGSCTASTVAVNYCQALVSDLGVSEVRVAALVRCSGVLTNPIIALVPGSYGVSTGVTRFSGAQLEPGQSGAFTHLIPTTVAPVTRPGENPLISNVPNPSSTWCIAVVGKPKLRTWVAWGGSIDLATWGAAPTNYVKMVGGAMTIGDSAGGVKSITGLTTPSLAEHRYVFCSNRGTLSYSLDGVVGGTVTGAGTGILTPPATGLYVGNRNTAGEPWNGTIRSIKLCKATKPSECK